MSSGFEINPGSDNPGSGSRQPGAGCLALFGLPFAAFGVVALVSAARKFREGASRDAVMMGLFGLVFSSVGFGLMAFAMFGKRANRRLKERQALHPDAPWLWRDDWASGEIRPNQRASTVAMWVFATLWNVISWMVAFAFLTDRQKAPPWVYLLLLLFPAIGLALLFVAMHSTLVWRRFGASVLRLKSPPAVLGGVLNGLIELNTRLPKEAPVQTRLTCLRRTVHQDSDGSHIQETVVWQDERALRPGLPEYRAGRTGIPVFFRPPAEQPPATPGESGAGSIVWRLGVEAHIKGPNLQLQFEVPVFRGDIPVAPAEDPTAKFQMPVESLRKALHSRITVTDARTGGKEFCFPAVRNVGAAIVLTLVTLVFIGATVFLGENALSSLRSHVNLFDIFFSLITSVFPLVFGAVALLLSVICADMWLRRTRLVADSCSLKSTQQWLFLKRQREFRTGEIRELFTKVGMASGTKQYHDLKARLDTGKEITLASALPSKPEADWLLAELKRALGRGDS